MDALKPRVSFLGLDFDDLPLPAVVARVLARPAAAPFAYVVTPNSDHLARLRRRPELRPLYAAAWMCLLDSRLLANLADGLGLKRPALATGVDLVAALLPQLAAIPECRVAVIGLAAAEISALRARFPALDWRHHEPPMGLRANPAAFTAAVEFAAASQARITFNRARRAAAGATRRRHCETPRRRRPRPVHRRRFKLCRRHRRSLRRPGCSAPGWNGCTAWPASRAAWPAAIYGTTRPSWRRYWRRPGAHDA